MSILNSETHTWSGFNYNFKDLLFFHLQCPYTMNGLTTSTFLPFGSEALQLFDAPKLGLQDTQIHINICKVLKPM